MAARPWRRQTVLSLFILTHLYCMASWGLPASGVRTAIVWPIEDYVTTMGLWHSWDMFSPDPLSIVSHVQARVRFQDGSVATWDFPRMEQLGLWERFQKERYRKLRERVRMDLFNGAWDDLARYIARLHDSPHNRPVEVTLTRIWEPIPAPAREPGTSRLRDDQPRPTTAGPLPNDYQFHRYRVRPEDL